MPKSLTVISLFSGAGGLDYGFESAGFRVRVAHDFDQDSCETVKANRNHAVICADIHETSGDTLLTAGKLEHGKASILIGGPPCQPFSKSSYWTNGDSRRLNDPRARTLEAYMRCVKETLPEVFLLENVHGIRYSGKEEGLLLLEKMTQTINRQLGTRYMPSWSVLNAADFGVPQMRERFFLVAHREGARFQFPAPTHRSDDKNEDQLALKIVKVKPSHVPVWHVIGGLRPRKNEDLEMRGRWAALLPTIPEGENYLWHTNRKGGRPLFGWRTHYWSFLLKLAKARPSWTLQAQPGPAIGPFHWNNRRLSVEEMARIQTFPKNLRYVGSRVSIQRQLGNAVPSLLAEVLAREIARQFFNKRYDEAPGLRVRLRGTIPPPEPVLDVRAEFMDLEGEHADHPGTGQGRAALKRARVLVS